MQNSDKTPMGERDAERAEFWRVSIKTVQRWRASVPPVPMHDVAAMVAWYAAQPSAKQGKLAPEFRTRIAELRTELGGAADPDYEEFQKQHSGKPSSDAEALEALKKQRDFAQFKIERATRVGDFAALNHATNLLKHFSAIIHDEEVRAQKLGREMGQLVPVQQVEQVARALPFWLLRATDELIADLAPKLVAASAGGPLGPEQVRHVLEPALLSKRLMTPFARSAQTSTGVSLPKWFIDAMAAGVDEALEDGAKAFARLYGDGKISP